jgi:hypothetical protein
MFRQGESGSSLFISTDASDLLRNLARNHSPSETGMRWIVESATLLQNIQRMRIVFYSSYFSMPFDGKTGPEESLQVSGKADYGQGRSKFTLGEQYKLADLEEQVLSDIHDFPRSKERRKNEHDFLWSTYHVTTWVALIQIVLLDRQPMKLISQGLLREHLNIGLVLISEDGKQSYILLTDLILSSLLPLLTGYLVRLRMLSFLKLVDDHFSRLVSVYGFTFGAMFVSKSVQGASITDFGGDDLVHAAWVKTWISRHSFCKAFSLQQPDNGDADK